jgi:hypothetical protein
VAVKDVLLAEGRAGARIQDAVGGAVWALAVFQVPQVRGELVKMLRLEPLVQESPACQAVRGPTYTR